MSGRDEESIGKTSDHKVPEISVAERLSQVLCSRPLVFNLWTLALISVSCFGALWSLTGDLMIPFDSNGYLFTIYFLYITAILFSRLAVLANIPGLVGMLIAGIVVRQIPFPAISNVSLSSSLKNAAFAVILIRAGLSLDLNSILRLKRTVFLLSIVPGCVVEASVVAVSSYLLLGFPWIWGFMLGFVLAAVSPAVVVPSLIVLQEKGLGVEQGIPSLVIAAASLDDIFAILGFTLALDICMTTGNASSYIMLGVELLVGVLAGLLLGALLYLFPAFKSANKIATRKFFLVILLFCVTFVLGAAQLDARGAGPLATLLFAVVVGRKNPQVNEVMEGWFKQLWQILMPFLFALIGYEVDVLVVLNVRALLCVLVISVGLLFRILASYLCTLGSDLCWKEQLFVAIAWSPKATVQAAIGSLPLDYVKSHEVSDGRYEGFAGDILTSAVLAILFTAPIGAIAIQLSGKKLLQKTATTSPGNVELVDKHSQEQANGDA